MQWCWSIIGRVQRVSEPWIVYTLGTRIRKKAVLLIRKYFLRIRDPDYPSGSKVPIKYGSGRVRIPNPTRYIIVAIEK